MPAKIAQGGSAEQRVDDGMDHGVGVGVAGESQFKGDGDASENEGTPRREGVYIVTRANVYAHPVAAPLMKASAISTSSCVVILILVKEPGKIATCCPRRSIRAASSVASSCCDWGM